MTYVLRNPLGSEIMVNTSSGCMEFRVYEELKGWVTFTRFYDQGFGDNYAEYLQNYAGFRPVEDNSGKAGG